MIDNEKELYNKALEQIPVRKEIMKAEVMKRYDRSFNRKNRTFRFAGSVAIAMVVVFLAVVILPKNNEVPLRVYAAEGEYVKLGKEAVSLKSMYEPHILTYSTLGKNQKEDYSCVFYFDMDCESEDVERITYKIQGENTYLNIAGFDKNDVWFAKVSDKEFDQNNGCYPFDYRYMETNENKEVFTYLGNKIVVDDNDTSGNYYIEYRINKDDNGNLYADSFEMKVIIEKSDGTTIERKLRFEPVLKMMENDVNGTGILNELWVELQ